MLNALFATKPDGTVRTGGRLTFAYAACRVTVDNGEYLTLEPIAGAFEHNRIDG